MEQKCNRKTVLKTAGAFAAWVMGSGFATGQEILQFFTSYGLKSYILAIIAFIGIALAGTAILEEGFANREDEKYIQTEHFCGKKTGLFFSWYIPLSLFLGMVIMISGAGATLNEYYGINHYVGALLMALAAFAAYVIGFRGFVRIASVIGISIICFTVIVGLATVIRDGSQIADVSIYQASLEENQPVRWWWLSGLLYIGYNITGGSMYYTALGGEAGSPKEAFYGALIGAAALIAAITIMNTAMLTDAENTSVLEIPALYLAKKISYGAGAVFSIILICGMFSTCSAMMWTVSSRFTQQGTKKSYIFAGAAALVAFMLGLFPFKDLVGIIYPYMGYIGLVYVSCVIVKKVKTKKSG